MKSWVKFGLFWGAFMFLMLNILFPLLDDSGITWKKLLISFPVWLAAGVCFGYVSQKKKIDE